MVWLNGLFYFLFTKLSLFWLIIDTFINLYDIFPHWRASMFCKFFFLFKLFTLKVVDASALTLPSNDANPHVQAPSSSLRPFYDFWLIKHFKNNFN